MRAYRTHPTDGFCEIAAQRHARGLMQATACYLERSITLLQGIDEQLFPKTPLDPILPTAQAGAVFRYIVP